MKRFQVIISIGAMLLTVGCCPRLKSPRVLLPKHYTLQPNSPKAPIEEHWWLLFQDKQLDHLIELALENNKDLRIAALNISSAQLRMKTAVAAYLPQVGGNITVGGERESGSAKEANFGGNGVLNWEVSLFGALRNEKRYAQAEIETSAWAYRGVRLSLAAQVAELYFTLLEYEQYLKISERSYVLRTRSAALIDSLNRYGMSDGVALAQARSLVYASEAAIPKYKHLITETRHELNVLIGDTVSTDKLFREAGFPKSLPTEIPAGLPSQILEHRPDLRKAQWELEAASASVGLAHAARFPSLSLTAEGGIAAHSLKKLTAHDPWVWSASGSITAPIFAFRKLKRAEQIAHQNYSIALIEYEQTVIEAFYDVENALAAIEETAHQVHSSKRLNHENQQIASMTAALYRNGFSNYLEVMDAEREAYASEMSLMNLYAQQYINYVHLFKALGAGWKQDKTDHNRPSYSR